MCDNNALEKKKGDKKFKRNNLEHYISLLLNLEVNEKDFPDLLYQFITPLAILLPDRSVIMVDEPHLLFTAHTRESWLRCHIEHDFSMTGTRGFLLRLSSLKFSSHPLEELRRSRERISLILSSSSARAFLTSLYSALSVLPWKKSIDAKRDRVIFLSEMFALF